MIKRARTDGSSIVCGCGKSQARARSGERETAGEDNARARATAASVAVMTLATSAPAYAGDLFGPEYAGAFQVGALILAVGVSAISALLLPFITGTLNPIQMAVNLGVIEGEISNERKFKRNGEPMEHGGRFGHKWYKTPAYCNGKYIDFAGVKKSMEAEQKAAAVVKK